MLKKKLFGLFGKKEGEEDVEAPSAPPEAPVISNDQISSLENLAEEPDSAEAPEDIISKLAQINSIIGQEEAEEVDELHDFFPDESPQDEVAGEETAQGGDNESPASVDTLMVAADLVLQSFPQDLLLDSVENLANQYGGSNDFSFHFERSDLLYGLSVGKLEFTIGQLVDKLPLNVFQDQITSAYNTKLELPIAYILPLVPVAWFTPREQDCSREVMVNEMEDLFASAPPPPVETPPESQEEEPTYENVDSDLGQATEQLPPTTSDNMTVEKTRWSTPSEDVPQEVVGVSQLKRSDQNKDIKPHDEEPIPEPERSTIAEPEIEQVADEQVADEQVAAAPPKVKPPPPLSKVESARVPRDLPQKPAVSAPKPIEEIPKPIIDADEVREVAAELFESSEHVALQSCVKDAPAAERKVAQADLEIEWKSQAPNGIDINRGGVEELSLLNGVGDHLARVIIDFRKSHGPFSRLPDLLNVPGLGKHTYRTMTRLSPRTNLRDAELKVNTAFNIKSENVSLNKISGCSLDNLKLDAMFVSSTDGLILTKSAATDNHMKLADSLAAVAPQLYKRSKKALQQGLLPTSDMITFYFDRRSVTFSGFDQLFVVFIHSTGYPNQKQLKECRKVTNELVWYCSYRAVLS